MEALKSKIVLVDMDGVLVEFNKGFDKKWTSLYPDKFFVPSESFTNFYITDHYPEDLLPSVKEIYNAPGFFFGLDPLPGAIEGIQWLEEQGAIVRICTAPVTTNPTCLQEKYDWVLRELGLDYAKNMITSSDKTLVLGDYLIDDRPKVHGLQMPSWEHILFVSPCTRELIDDRRRMHSWGDLKTIFG